MIDYANHAWQLFLEKHVPSEPALPSPFLRPLFLDETANSNELLTDWAGFVPRMLQALHKHTHSPVARIEKMSSYLHFF